MNSSGNRNSVIVIKPEPVSKQEFVDLTGEYGGFECIAPPESHCFPLASLRKELQKARARKDRFTPADLMLEDMLASPDDKATYTKLKMILSAVMLGREYPFYDASMQLIDDYTVENRLRLQMQAGDETVSEGVSRRCLLGMGFSAAFVANGIGLAAQSSQPPTKTRVAAIAATMLTGIVFSVLDFNQREQQISWKEAAKTINDRIAARLYLPQQQKNDTRQR